MPKNMKRWLAGGALILVAGAVPLASSVGAQDRIDFSGTYRASGVNPDGTRYSGLTVVITPYGDGYRVAWSDGRVVRGIGHDIDDIFSVGFSDDGEVGVAVYRVRNVNTLEGYWQMYSSNREGQEILTRVR